MRKVLLALTLTAVGLALLLSFKSRAGGGPVSALGNSAARSDSGTSQNTNSSGRTDTGTSPSPTPSTSSSTSSSSSSGSSSSSSSGSGSSSSGSGSTKAVSGTFTGSAVDTRYGEVQVQAVLSNGKLTNVNVLQVPDNGGYEDQIVAVALPELKSEALSAQSGNIDIVSGATYTSEGYAQSLQAALDKAGV